MKQAGENSARGLGCWLYLKKELKSILVNPLHPNISIHFLHTVLYTFPMILTKRICLTIKSFFSCIGDHFLYSHDLNVCFRGDTDGRK